MTKRNRVDHKFAVLDACMCQVNTTHLMYRVNINFAVLSEIAADLFNKGLLVEKVVRKRSFFKTSANGYELLKEWRQLKVTVGA